VIRRLLTAGALCLLVGCSASAVSADVAPAPAPEPAAEPAAITIPAIDAHSSLIPLGLTEAGELATPPVDDPGQAGYYAGPDPAFTGDEVLPGERGPSVVVGHVDGVIDGQKGQPGVFHKLHNLQPGDEILIDREDGSQVRFVVERVEQHAKDAFPTEQVYGDTDRPELRLVTCGGSFNEASGHYTDNVVVWASLP
jgi:hypothetical protein